jgi:hypothetical protein
MPPPRARATSDSHRISSLRVAQRSALLSAPLLLRRTYAAGLPHGQPHERSGLSDTQWVGVACSRLLGGSSRQGARQEHLEHRPLALVCCKILRCLVLRSCAMTVVSALKCAKIEYNTATVACIHITICLRLLICTIFEQDLYLHNTTKCFIRNAVAIKRTHIFCAPFLNVQTQRQGVTH